MSPRPVGGAVNTGFQLDAAGPRAYQDHLVPAFFEPCAERLLALSPPTSGERVLDLACGTGVVARRAAAAVGTAGRVVGLDVNAAMIGYAASVDPSSTVEWAIADAGDLPVEDGGIDLVCCQQGLQFFADPPAALGEARRVLAADGRMLVAMWRPVEHNPGFGVVADALERRIGPDAATIMRSPFAGPSIEQLRAWSVDSGLPVVECEIAAFPARFASIRSFLREEVAATPLAGPIEAADPRAVALLEADLEDWLAPYVDDQGLALPMQTWLVVARS